MKDDCPDCNKPMPWKVPMQECTATKPLWMVIPPGGVHLECPVHPEGHHIHGTHYTLS